MSMTAVDALIDGRSLESAVAWVTGAGRGIGRASAIALSRLGATVHLLSRTEADLHATRDSIVALGGSAFVHVCDVTDNQAIAHVFDGQQVDVLVNSAGTNVPQSLNEVTPEAYDAIMRVNVRAPLFASQEAVRRMRALGSKGAIVNISSQMGHVGGPQRAVYCSSKWAIEGMTKALALELAAEGIRVNSVAPTFVSTGFSQASLADPEFRRWVLDSIPMGRFATEEDVAAAVAYLASPISGLVTGTSLVVDGGWTAR